MDGNRAAAAAAAVASNGAAAAFGETPDPFTKTEGLGEYKERCVSVGGKVGHGGWRSVGLAKLNPKQLGCGKLHGLLWVLCCNPKPQTFIRGSQAGLGSKNFSIGFRL
jgi:hypothetical protein